MAIQYVGGTSNAGTSTGYTVSLSGTLTGGLASSPAAGDLVVVFSGFGNTASSAPVISGNNSGAYTGATTAQHVNDTWDTEFRSFYAIMGGTPDTSLTVTRTTNAAYGGATVVQVWRGVDTVTPFIGAGTNASAGNTSLINPPAYDPAVTGAIIIAGGAGTQAPTSNDFTGFTGMSNFITRKGDGTTADCGVAMASYAYLGVSYDPPVVSGGTGGNASSSWAGVTIAFRPIQPTAYTLSGVAGSYSITGQIGTLTYTPGTVPPVNYALSGVAGSYSITGNAATLTYTLGHTDYVLFGAAGSYVVTGRAATLQVNRQLAGAAGSYSLTGNAGGFKVGRQLAGAAGSYALTGNIGSFKVGRQLPGATGSYAITGNAASLSYTPGSSGTAYSLAGAAGSYAITGTDALLIYSGATVEIVHYNIAMFGIGPLNG